MPSITNVVCKKNDGTTDVTYNAVTPFAGPSQPAVWLGPQLGNAVDHCPQVRLSSRASGDGKSRVLRETFVYPTVVSNGAGGYTINYRARKTVEWVIPTGMPQTTDWYEFVSQSANFDATSTIRDVIKAGFAPS